MSFLRGRQRAAEAQAQRLRNPEENPIRLGFLVNRDTVRHCETVRETLRDLVKSITEVSDHQAVCDHL